MSPRTSVAVSIAVALVAGLSFVRGEASSTQPAERVAADALERDVVALLAAADPNADLATLQTTLAPALTAAVERHFPKLNAGEEATVIESTDGRFVVVVIGDAPDGVVGKDVRATSDAALLLAVGGRAGARPRGGQSYGGKGFAEATRGIGIGLGGPGGKGDADGVAGGGGGPAGATGGVGALSLGGPGGAGGPNGDPGKPGSGVDPTNLAAVVAAAKAWDEKK